MADCKKVMDIIRSISSKMEEQKEYLTELDQPIGDSDHGINMARGFAAVEQKLDGMASNDVGAVLKAVGMALVSSVGGASGPLYGSAYMKAGAAAAGKSEIGISDFLLMLKEAAEAVSSRGKSQAGEATMLDAILPSLKAMEEALQAGKDAKTVLEAGTAAAWKGAESTKDMIATKGRASYVGERGLGHQDPGATSYAYMLQTIKENI